MKHDYSRLSNAESKQTLFGIAFLLMVAILITIDVISSRYSNTVTTAYYIHRDDTEDTNTPVRGDVGHLIVKDVFHNISSIETDIDSDLNKTRTKIDSDVSKSKTETVSKQTETNIVENNVIDAKTNDRGDGDKAETVDETLVKKPETNDETHTHNTDETLAKETDTNDETIAENPDTNDETHTHNTNDNDETLAKETYTNDETLAEKTDTNDEPLSGETDTNDEPLSGETDTNDETLEGKPDANYEPLSEETDTNDKPLVDKTKTADVENFVNKSKTNNSTSEIFDSNSVDMSKPVHGNSEHNKTIREFFAEFSSIKVSPANIFFVESRCATEKAARPYLERRSFVLNARQCCAVESTARENPDRPVYVFYSCYLYDDFTTISAPYAGRLMNYENVRVVRLLPREVFHGTPVEALAARGALEASAYPVEHTSDLLRLALLWRFGGAYCDLDVVTIKPLSPLGQNWAGMQDAVTIANGVLAVAPSGEAHDMLGEALAHVNLHYEPRGWSSNGPELITPLILKHCGVRTVSDAMAYCRMDFIVLPSPFLYPLYYTQYGDLFDDGLGPRLVTSLKQTAYSVHLWNKLSHDRVATVGSQQAYSLLAQEFCPEVYGSCGDTF